MRHRGRAGRHERQELGREDEDPFVAMDCGFLKVDGTEDDDDEDDEKDAEQDAHLCGQRCENRHLRCNNLFARERRE